MLLCAPNLLALECNALNNSGASDGIIILYFVLILPLRYFTRLFINELLLVHVCRAYAYMHNHLHICCSFTSSPIIVCLFPKLFCYCNLTYGVPLCVFLARFIYRLLTAIFFYSFFLFAFS